MTYHFSCSLIRSIHYLSELEHLCLGHSLKFLLECMQALTEKGYDLVSGGTENHLVLVNLKPKVHMDYRTPIFVLYVTSLMLHFPP